MSESVLAFAPWPRDRLLPGPLPEHEVAVWAVDLDVTDAVLARLVDDLSPEEKARARRFVFERDRRRFQVARGTLKRLLSAYTGIGIHELCLSYGPNGKPELCLGGSTPLQFNVAHSGDMAVLAFTASLPVGVDLEERRLIPDALEIARSTFSRNEISSLESLPDNARHEGFLRCWTRKEAYVKATGEGLNLALDSFDVTVRSDSNVDIGLDRVNGDWSLYHFEPSAGYVGALAVAGNRHTLRGWLAEVTLPDDRGK